MTQRENSYSPGNADPRLEGPRRMRLFPIAATALTILALAFLTASPGSAAPQDQAPSQGTRQHGRMSRRHGNEMQWLSSKLSLTDTQKTKIKPILDSEHQQMKSLWQDSSLSREQKRARFAEIRSKTMDQIRPILTEEQRATLEQMQKQRAERMKAWHEQHGGNSGSAPQSQ